jgi:hypothetical protein
MVKFQHLTSKSTFGRISEAHLCKQYANTQKESGEDYIPSAKLTLDVLTGKLAKAASTITENWRS